MEAPIEFQEWEILQGPEAPVPAPTHVAGIPENATDGSYSDDGIRPDYFALDSSPPQAERFDLDHTEVHSDSDKPSWVDPEELKGNPASSELWTSDESCEEQNSPRVLESSDLDRGDCSNLMGDAESDGGSVEGSGSCDGAAASGGKLVSVWWKLPMEILKFCVVKVRPVWPISVAAALVGFLVLGRKLYKMRRRSRNPPKVSIDDKKASLFSVQAARLNEAFSVVRRMPVIKPPLAPAGVTPWPVLALR